MLRAVLFERQPFRLVEAALGLAAVCPPHDADESDERDHGHERADIVDVHGYLDLSAVPRPCRYAISASCSVLPASAALAPAMSASLYGCPRNRSTLSFASMSTALAGVFASHG